MIQLQLVDGVVWGTIFALIALGLTLVYGYLGLVNLAHGSLYMLGAVGAWYITEQTGSFWWSLAAAPLGVVVVGVAMHLTVVRKVVARDTATGILVTAGVLIIIDQTTLQVFGGNTRPIQAPLSGSIPLGSVSYPVYRVFVAGIALLIMVGLVVFLKKTHIGLWMRSVAQSRELATAMGVPIKRITLITFLIGAYFAGIAGVLTAPIVSANYQMGVNILALAFIVVVVGGLGSLQGALVAALILGVARGLLTVVLAPTVAQVVAILCMVPLLLIRPHGIFGEQS